MKNWIIIIMVLTTGLSSCTNLQNDNDIFIPRIIVEGWIEEGTPATVILTQMLPYNKNSESGPLNINDIPIKWATVSISDGERSEMLVGRIDNDYNPPYVYAGSAIRGEAGKEYTLTVKYSGRLLTASTTVPETVPIDRYEVSASPSCDTLYSIKIYFTDDPEQRNYYKAFTKVKNTDKRYFAAFMGDLSDEVIGPDAYMTVNRAFRHTRLYHHTPYFMLGDTVYVKFTQLPEEGFEFWSSYENEVTNGSNILFPNTYNLKTNINGGGRGIWCGYGACIQEIIIRDEIKK